MLHALHTEPMTILANDERFQVTAQRFEIMFRDGTSIGLHQVWQNGTPAALLRATRFANSLVIFDLTHLHRELARELPSTATRDVPGLVFFSLRTRFRSLDEMMAMVLHAPRAIIPCLPAPSQAEAVAA